MCSASVIVHSVSLFIQELNMGAHAGGIRCMEYNAEGGIIVSGGWDATVKVCFSSRLRLTVHFVLFLGIFMKSENVAQKSSLPTIAIAR